MPPDGVSGDRCFEQITSVPCVAERRTSHDSAKNSSDFLRRSIAKDIVVRTGHVVDDQKQFFVLVVLKPDNPRKTGRKSRIRFEESLHLSRIARNYNRESMTLFLHAG